METWNVRTPKLEDERRYQNLVDIHQLTQEWLIAINPNQDPSEKFKLQRFVPPQLTQNLWLLEKLRLDQLPPLLETLVNATRVSEFLDELEETIWIVQMSLFENMIGPTHDTNRSALFNQLEQVTWHHGKTLAEKRWPKFSDHHAHPVESLPLKIFNALKNSPFYSSPQSFLLERSSEKVVSFYWMTSPLARKSLSSASEILTFCHLQHHGLRGYLYGLIRKLNVEIMPATLKDKKVWQIKITVL